MSDYRDQVIFALEKAQTIIDGMSPVPADDDEGDVALCAQNGMQQRCSFVIEQMIANVRADRPADHKISRFVIRSGT